MIKKEMLFAVSILTASICTTARAQDNKPAPPPAAVERQVQIFTNGGDESYLGIKLQEVTKENFAKFGLKEIRGAAITEVAENSPAAQAGLKVGDVVVKLDDEEIKSVRKLQRMIGEIAPDRSAKITIFRAGSEKTLTVVIGKRPVSGFENASVLEEMYGLPGIPEFPSPGRSPRVIVLPEIITVPNIEVSPQNNSSFGTFMSAASTLRRTGIRTVPLTKQLAEYFGAPDEKGLLITEVGENSSAAAAGLKSGDVIIEADGKPPTARDSGVGFGNNDKKSVILTIIRDKNRQTVTVKFPEIKEESPKLQVAPNT